ncbi:hypothetical protein PRIC2_004322 [Phytophthora ramorum]
MHPHHIVVVAVIALLACVGHASASAEPKIVITPDSPTPARALTKYWNDTPTKRMLRSGNEGDAEERVLGLEKITEAAKSATAKIRQNMDIRTWLKEGQSADEVANLLSLDKKVDSVLSNPNFNALAKYISKFNKQNAEEKVSMIGVLTRRYGESAVSKMLVAAKDVPRREVWATKLQGDQVAGWINSKKSPVDVFRILKLDDAEASPLIARNLKAWTNYVTVLTKREPAQATTMFETFRNVYKDDGLARLIDKSKFEGGVLTVAMDLKTSLFTRWKQAHVTKNNINTKIFKLKNGDEIDDVAKRIIAQYGEYLDTGALYLYKLHL